MRIEGEGMRSRAKRLTYANIVSTLGPFPSKELTPEHQRQSESNRLIQKLKNGLLRPDSLSSLRRGRICAHE